MLYLSAFSFPDGDREFDFILSVKRTCYDTFYPFKVLSAKGLTRLDFEPITLLYGGNGSGKSTALNIIAEKIGLRRESVFNKSNFYSDYLRLCEAELAGGLPGGVLPEESAIITSDDVFDYMLDIRSLNEGIDTRREEVFQEYLDAKYAHFQLNSLADYDRLKKVNKARSKTQSKFTRSELIDTVREYSNGENAFRYFTEKIGENGLFILDEPENSLSPKRQISLSGFIEDAARFFGCQFIISTHSPFLLALRGAKIYDLDDNPVTVKPWTELEHVRIYYDFFKAHETAF